MNKRALYESIMTQVAQVVKKELNENMEIKDSYAIYEKMKEQLGAETLLEDLVQVLSADELEENLRFIDKERDLGFFDEYDGIDDDEDDDDEL